MGQLRTLTLTERQLDFSTFSLPRGSRKALGSRLSSKALGISVSELVDVCGRDMGRLFGATISNGWYG